MRSVVGMMIVMCSYQDVAHAAPIRKYENVVIGGIRQAISLKGVDSLAPLLLFLHGGPGNSAMGYDEKFTKELQKHFVVVQWDQRDTERTLKLNRSDKPLTVDLMVDDAVEMIRYLNLRFSKKKIWLMGHSWGGFLALMVTGKNPELVEACFAVCPMVDQLKSERVTLDLMINRATETKNTAAQEELKNVAIPFANAQQLYLDRKWIAIFSGKKPPAREFVLQWGKTWFTLFSEARAVNLFEKLPEIKSPVYFLVGKKDIQTHYSVTAEYYNA
ncbi:MAG TPA: alpha/beta hydrolase, partial [Cyclobacteriaceae bacterium]|nr:alpha/beta hydrolase [Cyclobacteriaceae bacterium]